MKTLLERYNIDMEFVEFIIKVDDLTPVEIEDVDYLEDRIIIHLENQESLIH